MKYRYAFLLGRPGCGKSALYRELEARILAADQGLTVERVDDYPKLWAALVADDALQAEGKARTWSIRTSDGDYELADNRLLDRILKEVNADLLAIDSPDHLVVVEFARPNNVAALQSFDRRILDASLVIYLKVSFETCWKRNVARHLASSDAGGDDHWLNRAMMEQHYLYDDQEVLIQHLKEWGMPIAVVDNEAEGKEHLRTQVERLYQEHFRSAPDASTSNQLP